MHSSTVSSKESLGPLMNTHYPGTSGNHTVEYTQGSVVEIDSTPIIIVSESNVYNTINSFKLLKSSGPEGLFPAQLQYS